jgi:hypothetical protein
MGGGGTAPLILNLDTRWRYHLFPVEELRYSLIRMACSQIRYGKGKGKDKFQTRTGLEVPEGAVQG